MAWPLLATIAKAIPWGTLVQQAPAIIESANKLRTKNKPKESIEVGEPSSKSQMAALQSSVETLETHDREAAEVVRQLALQSQEMVINMQALEKKVRLLLFGVLFALAVAATAVVTILL
ncbi:MAG: hypothetical protein ACI8P9_003611 [Parasphingorhabdus sp.]|jgi:hypothetical protein